jgi:parallel beta-helix repeat protein
MKRVFLATALVVGLGAALLPALAHAATCTQTGFFRDNINMTAAQIGGNVTGELDATGCNIGVYYDNTTSGNVSAGANIHDANYFGVVVNGDAGAVSVNVTNATINHIGEPTLNGTQHGVAIYYRGFGTGTASGTISGNTLTNYQKGGITIAGSSSATITTNTVTGQGPVDYIAQNGIEVAWGAKATVTGNTVTGNSYTGANGASSAGILIVGGPGFNRCGTSEDQPCPYTVGVNVSKNTATGNDVGVWLFNATTTFMAPSTATNETVKFNTISNGAVTNTTGLTMSPPCGYQAGIADLGKKDLIVNNTISGTGYTPSRDCGDGGVPNAFVRAIDLTSKARGVPSNK